MFYSFAEPAGLDFTSPSWVGAWWLGFIVCGIFYLLAAIPLFCFPYRMPDKRKLVEKMESNIMMRNGRAKVGDDNESLPYETSCCKRIKDTTKGLITFSQAILSVHLQITATKRQLLRE